MGEVKDQRMHPLLLAPKVPGRFYFVFGKPIETRGTGSETFRYIISQQSVLFRRSLGVSFYVGYRRMRMRLTVSRTWCWVENKSFALLACNRQRERTTRQGGGAAPLFASQI
jgi:hypothetical protein